MAESNVIEVHIILKEVEDARFPGVKGVQIEMDPEPEGESPDDYSRVELTALQMIQLFHLYQATQGARQFVDNKEMTLPFRSEEEFQWPDVVEVKA